MNISVVKRKWYLRKSFFKCERNLERLLSNVKIYFSLIFRFSSVPFQLHYQNLIFNFGLFPLITLKVLLLIIRNESSIYYKIKFI